MGNHAEVVARTFDRDPGDEAAGQTPFVVGALAFLGRLEEAKFLFDRAGGQLSATDAAASRFFLALGFCRHSQYETARRYLGINLRAAGRDAEPLLRFFADQGLGFYRFFCGRYRDALRYARSALLAATGAKSAYGKFLATDLSGHALVHAGQIAEGLAHLQRALGLARGLGNGSMAEATEIGLACYEAQFGLTGRQTVDRLRELYERLDPQNTYSRATLLLELARQWTLRGDVGTSKQYLDEACRIIYSLRHRRQSAAFNHRHAYNLFLAGDDLQALNLIRLAKSEIHPAVDLALDLQLSGLQLDICRRLALAEDADRLRLHVERLTARTGSYLAGRVLARRRSSGPTAYPAGQDALGDMLDGSGGLHGLRALLEAGYNTPFRVGLGLARKEQAVVAAPALGAVLVVDPPSVTSAGAAPTRQLRALLRELAGGEQAKEALIGAVWGYKYHPGRHDPLIHQAMARLREALGDSGHWLEFTGHGYRLRPGVAVLLDLPGSDRSEPPAAAGSGPAVPPRLDADRARSAMILEYLKEHRSVDARTCVGLFQVTRVTASRDLALLLKKKVIRKLGSGRATRYELVQRLT